MKNCLLVVLLILLPNVSAFAGDFQWSGLYRIEGYQINNSSLDDGNREKSYGLHHLVLRPRIEAADGLTIRARFDIFNNNTYMNDPMGQIWGAGVGLTPSAPTSTVNSNSVSQNQAVGDLRVSEMYLTLVQEFGALVAGRVPLHFGLGMVHNAGKGPFDHFMDNRDLVGYKIVMGNLFFLPMYAKVVENDLLKPDDVTDILMQFQYENPESGLEMGLFYQGRTSTQGNDYPAGTTTPLLVGGAGAVTSKQSTRQINFYGLKDTKDFRFGLEGGWQEGQAGVQQTNGNEVELSGFGMAVELEFRPESSKYAFGFKAGMASGDDPGTDDKYEGFIFDRNYDVGYLLFNHTLGNKNLLRTEMIGTGNTDGAAVTSHNTPDIEAISNAYYFSPQIKYKWNDRWTLDTSLTFGFINTDPINGVEIEKSLGYELDISFNFKPNDRVTWVNGVGMMFPGAAFKAGDINDFSTSFAYGFITKAAISF